MSKRIEAGETRRFFEQERLQGVVFQIAEGEAAVYSAKSPAKDTPNEDAAGLLATGATSAILIVADGVGGAPAGGQASSIAINHVVEAVERGLFEGREVRAGILDGFESANEAVLSLGFGAGTTLTVVEIEGRTVRPYHAGDSFVLVTGQRGKIKLQTISHSPVGYGVEAGFIDETEAMYHEERHLISNMIGSAQMRIDVGSTFELARRDTLILASDGLSDNLHNDEIVDCMRKGKLRKVVPRLERMVRERMEGTGAEEPSKPDDLTFLLFRLSR